MILLLSILVDRVQQSDFICVIFRQYLCNILLNTWVLNCTLCNNPIYYYSSIILLCFSNI